MKKVPEEIYGETNKKISPKQQLILLENKRRNIWVHLFFVLMGALFAGLYLVFSYNDLWNPGLKPANFIIAISAWIFMSVFLIVYWNLLIEVKKQNISEK